MLAKCVNPSCDNRFKHLREGRLLRVERRTSPSRRKFLSEPRDGVLLALRTV